MNDESKLCPCGRPAKNKYCSQRCAGLYVDRTLASARSAASRRRQAIAALAGKTSVQCAAQGYKQGYQAAHARYRPIKTLKRLRAVVAAALSSCAPAPASRR